MIPKGAYALAATGLVAAGLAACSRSQPEAKPAASKAEATASGGPAESAAWLLFRAPLPADPASGASGGAWTAHGGPDWSFDAPGLPALSADGARAAVPIRETSLSGVPNIAVGIQGITRDTLEGEHSVLSSVEFLAAAAAEGGRAFSGLADSVRMRLAGIDSLRKREAWKTMAPCALPDSQDASQPPCSGASQRIECKGVSFTYAEGVLAAGQEGATRTFARPNWIHGPAHDATVGKVPVKGCFGSAWFDRENGVFLGEMLYACQGGGDACIEQPRWHAVRMATDGGRK